MEVWQTSNLRRLRLDEGKKKKELEIWANAQRDGSPAERRWRPLFTPQSLADAHYYMPCSNVTMTRNQLKFGGVPQSNETISAASGPKFTILWIHLEDILLLNIFSDRRYVP